MEYNTIKELNLDTSAREITARMAELSRTLDIQDKYRRYTNKGWTILGYQPLSSAELPLQAL